MTAVTKRVGRKQTGKWQELVMTYYGPGSNYQPAAIGNALSYCEEVQAFDMEETQEGYDSYTFIEYRVNGTNQRKRAYIETSLCLNLDDVHYVVDQYIQDSVYDGWQVTQGFNDKTTKRRGHLGYDMVEAKKEIKAIFDGKIMVYNPLDNGKNGKCIILKHQLGNGEPVFYSCYGHMASLSNDLRVGDMVKQGSQIGVMGNTGGVAPHLHLGVFTTDDEANLSIAYAGYSADGSKSDFEHSGTKEGIASSEPADYDYIGYYFDGPRANGCVFYDPLAVIYTEGKIIKNHPHK